MIDQEMDVTVNLAGRQHGLVRQIQGFGTGYHSFL